MMTDPGESAVSHSSVQYSTVRSVSCLDPEFQRRAEGALIKGLFNKVWMGEGK